MWDVFVKQDSIQSYLVEAIGIGALFDACGKRKSNQDRCAKLNTLMQLLLSVTVLLVVLCTGAADRPLTVSGVGRTPAEWKSRTIYQIITDRFALSPSSEHGSGSSRIVTESFLPSQLLESGSTEEGSQYPPIPACAQNETYCGGTFAGIASKLDYITGMGFDAIWISPVVANFGHNYHGYAAQNLYEINPHFGGADGLSFLVEECHKRDVWVMVDVVGNHMGIPPNYDFSQVTPFNESRYYHDCALAGCPRPNCWINDFNDQPQVELCRLDGLPDLNQTDTFVSSTLYSWISDLVTKFDIDGLRIDTVAEVNKPFWAGFQKAAGVYAVGEVFNGVSSYVGPYQDVVDGLLNYPLYFSGKDVFAYQNSMVNLVQEMNSVAQHFSDPSLLGVFTDNHDNPRFLSLTSDIWLYKAFLTYSLTTTGIPIVYYGSEQYYSGQDTPHNRAPMWLSNYSTNTDLYKYISTVVSFRKQAKITTYPQKILSDTTDTQFLAYTRGDSLILVSNNGGSVGRLSRTFTGDNTPWPEGTKACNLFWPDSDFITVENGALAVFLDHGESKIYHPDICS